MGVRTLALEERQHIEAHRIPVCYWPPQTESELGNIIDGLRQDVYISVDLDVLDPAEMPAVGTPEPGGMRWLELIGILRRVCQERRVVGFDVCELAPDQGLPAHSYTAAKLVYKLIAYALTLGPS